MFLRSLPKQKQSNSRGKFYKNYIDQAHRSNLTHGWMHNTPWSKHNQFSYWQAFRRPIRKTIINHCARARDGKGFYSLLVGRIPGFEHDPVNIQGLINELSTAGPYTLFCPSDKALSQISPKSWQEMHSDPMKLSRFIKRHVVKGKFKLAEVVNSMNVVNGFEEREEEFFKAGKNVREKIMNQGSFERKSGNLNSNSSSTGSKDSKTRMNFNHNSFNSGINSTMGSVSDSSQYNNKPLCLSSEPVHYLYPERALITNLVEDIAETGAQRTRDENPFIYDELEMSREEIQRSSKLQMQQIQGNSLTFDTDDPFANNMTSTIPDSLTNLSNSDSDINHILPTGHNESGPLSSQSHDSDPRSGPGLTESELQDAYRLYYDSPPNEMQHQLKLNKIRYRLPYGFQYTTFGAADMRTLENPHKRIPVFIDGHLEDQYYYGQERKVLVSNEYCNIVRTSLCWNGYVHLVDGVMTP